MSGERLLPESKAREPLTIRDIVFGCGGLLPTAYRLPVICIMWVSLGVFLFVEVEGIGLVSSIYVIAQIVTTVGYGDVTVQPHSQVMKVLLSFYCLFGVGVAAELVNQVCGSIVQATEDRARQQMRAIEANLAEGGNAEETWLWAHRKKINGVIAAFGLWGSCIVFGTIYFGLMDNCVCADGMKPCDALQFSDVVVTSENGSGLELWMSR